MNKPLVKITIRIYREDLDDLQVLFPQPVGYNKAVREIIHAHLRALKEKISKKESKNEPVPRAPRADVSLGPVNDEGPSRA